MLINESGNSPLMTIPPHFQSRPLVRRRLRRHQRHGDDRPHLRHRGCRQPALPQGRHLQPRVVRRGLDDDRGLRCLLAGHSESVDHYVLADIDFGSGLRPDCAFL